MSACMKTLSALVFLCLLTLSPDALPAEKSLTIKGVRYFSYASFTRVVFEVEAMTPYVLTRAADRRHLMLSAYEAPLLLKAQLPPVHDGVVSGMESREEGGRRILTILLEAAAGEVKDFVLRGPDRIVLDIAKSAAAASASAQLPASRPKVIVLDAGHGGRDTGIALGDRTEKAFTLDFSLSLRKMLTAKDPGLSVVLTREKDKELALDERAAIANTAGALLFISIHATPGAHARVYIQDLDEGMIAPVASVAAKDFFGVDASSEHQEMLWGGQQAGHVKESGSLGRKLMRQLGNREGAEPVQAPLALLRAVDAAAVLVEVGSGQDRVVATEAVLKGIEEYVRENR